MTRAIHYCGTRLRLTTICIFLMFLATGLANADILFYDNCEDAPNTNHWKIHEDPDAVTVANNPDDPARNGRGSYKMIKKAGAHRVEIDAARIPLGHPRPGKFAYDKEYWVGFSVYIPEDYVQPADWSTWMQFHVTKDFREEDNCPDEQTKSTTQAFSLWADTPSDVPQMAAVISCIPKRCSVNDYEELILASSPNRIVSPPMIVGGWNDVVVHFKFNWDPDKEAFNEAWLNGVKWLDLHSSNQDIACNTHNDRFPPYLKLGMYSSLDDIPVEHILYYDEIRIGDENSSYDEVAPKKNTLAISALTLVNADTDRDIQTLSSTNTINLHQYPRISIRADTDPETVGSVVFRVNGVNVRTENVHPYTIAGDSGADYLPWDLGPGTYTIEAVPFESAGGQGIQGSASSVTLLVTESEPRTEIFTPIEDAYMDNGALKNVDVLRVQNSSRRVRESYIKFSVTGIADGTVDAAELRVTCAADPGHGNLKIHLGSHNDWDERNLDASTPSKALLLDARNSTYASGTEYMFDVSSAITTDGEYTFIMTMDGGGNDVAFHSSEGSAGPELVVTTGSGPRNPNNLRHDTSRR